MCVGGGVGKRHLAPEASRHSYSLQVSKALTVLPTPAHAHLPHGSVSRTHLSAHPHLQVCKELQSPLWQNSNIRRNPRIPRPLRRLGKFVPISLLRAWAPALTPRKALGLSQACKDLLGIAGWDRKTSGAEVAAPTTTLPRSHAASAARSWIEH
uniref:Uncharacterized protein n=1 Tax=Rousettus aegyptiacus TaxID=9407 RepID=A0A7J8ILD1_ROUAE|nr:hypothetical protein HJG63_010614 [Rousettus aegyptiacus]